MGLARYYCGKLLRDYLPQGLGQKIQQRRKSLHTWRTERAKAVRVRRYGMLTPAELHDELIAAGVRSGCVLLVHSSFGDFTNFSGTALDVLDVLEKIVGPSGTLVMPAQYVSKQDTFNVNRHPASVGLLNELFRRREGTLRSGHPGQSVCAKGLLASELVKDHLTHPLGCGPVSPFAKLLNYESQILGLGLPPLWTTFLHVVEDLALDEFPFSMYGSANRTFQVVDAEGIQQSVTIPLRCEKMLARINPRKLARHVNATAHREFSIKGLPCFIAQPEKLYTELKQLSKRGITAYG